MKTPIPLPPDEELQRAYPGIWSWYEHRFPNPEHPIVTRLTLALVRRLSFLWTPPGWKSSRFPEGARPLPVLLAEATMPYWVGHQDELRQVYDELRDLLTRLHPLPLARANEVLFRHTLEAFRKQNLLVEEIEELQRKLAKAPKGPTPTKRAIAVEALEFRLRNPECSWGDLANRFCQCDAGKRAGHDKCCQENMRQAVNELNEALKSYGV